MKKKVKATNLIVGEIYQRDNFKPFYLISICYKPTGMVDVVTLSPSGINVGHMNPNWEFNEIS